MANLAVNVAVDWFTFDELPSSLSLGHKRRIQDAMEGATGIAVDRKSGRFTYRIKSQEKNCMSAGTNPVYLVGSSTCR